MGWLRTIGTELLGLFADDAWFAGAVLLWLLASGLVLPRLGLPTALPPVVLFAGLVAILVESATRRARGSRQR